MKTPAAAADDVDDDDDTDDTDDEESRWNRVGMGWKSVELGSTEIGETRTSRRNLELGTSEWCNRR